MGDVAIEKAGASTREKMLAAIAHLCLIYLLRILS